MKVKITETVLRDSQQSLIATRMPFSDFEGILETLDNAGYYSLECWGGATFDSCLRYLDEDPWERLRKIKAVCKKTPLQMLIRGQNILGYKHYPDDVVRLFCRKAAENGMDIFRIFDALNDFRNIEVCIDEVKKCNKHAQGCICYTTSPVHTIEKYVEMGKQLVDMGVDSIAIKDMAGICGPQEAYDLVKALKGEVKVPIQFHTHATTGLGPITLVKAVEAGVDTIDCAISTMGGGTSQPATESMNYALKQLGYETDLDEDRLKKTADFFKPVRQKFLDEGRLNPTVLGIRADILKYQVPGGMLSNMVSQLKEQGHSDKLTEVLEEVPKVRKDLGEPPLVTPSSQIVGTQAVMNVLMGERYKVASGQTKDLCLGKYGQTIKPMNPEVVKKIIGDQEPITCRPADLIPPQLPQYEEDIKQWKQQDEDVLSYALFPQVATEFFKYRETQRTKVDPTIADTENKVYPV